MLLQITDPYDVPEQETAITAIGIDLGTTNSVVAYVKDGKPYTLCLEGKNLTPSVICQGENIFRSTKRLFDHPTQKLQGTDATPLSIATSLLKELKEKAEKALEKTVTHAVITVPAYFDEKARQATKKAAEDAGLTVLRLIAEPTAAALAYGLDKGVEGLYAIFDLGGGTFDFSLLKLQGEVFQVLATGGDVRLGGDDIDAAICEHCAFSDLEKARLIKESVSDSLRGFYNNDDQSNSNSGDRNNHKANTSNSEFPLSADDLEKLSQPFIQRALSICRGVLRDARLTVRDIEGIVLVGGSTRLTCLRKAVKDFFERAPLIDINPDEVVAHGAALQANALTHGGNMLLIDVTPLGLGIETMGGLVEKIIPRNTPLPCHMAQDFTTSVDGQTALMIHIVQGEREFVKDCRSLGQFILSGIPLMKAHSPRIRVSFQLDADGLLTVSALEQTTQTQQVLSIKPTVGLEEEMLEEMLLDAASHGASDMEERLFTQTRQEAEETLLRLNNALTTLHMVLEDSPELLNAVSAVEDAIHLKDRASLKNALKTLNSLCDPLANQVIVKILKDS